MAPYLWLLAFGPKAGPSAATASSLSGFIGSIAWYALGYASTSMSIHRHIAPGIIGAVHPIVPRRAGLRRGVRLCARRAEAGAAVKHAA